MIKSVIAILFSKLFSVASSIQKMKVLLAIALYVIVFIDDNVAESTVPPTIIPLDIPSDNPTERPSTNTAIVNPNDPTKLDVRQCFIGAKCEKAKDCCPNTMDQIYRNGIKCSITTLSTSDKNTNGQQFYCCVENGYLGCSLDDHCCNEKSVCFEGVCINGKRHKNAMSLNSRDKGKNAIDGTITVGQILIGVFGICFLSASIGMYVYTVRTKNDSTQYHVTS